MTYHPEQQAPHIDEEGNVLYLNQELLDKKENPFPRYRDPKNGLGIFNWLLDHVIYMSKERWPLALKLYKFFIHFSGWMKKG